jgi:NADH-quinone oxidoreductase subunit K
LARWCWPSGVKACRQKGKRKSAEICSNRQKVRRETLVPISYYLALSAVLFGLGVIGFVFKRNIITIFMSIELMLNAVNLAFIAFGRALGQLQGQVFVFFVIVVAAAEAAVGLAIVIVISRNRQSLNVERINLLKL